MCCNETYPKGKYLLITLNLLKLAYLDGSVGARSDLPIATLLVANQ